MTTTKNAFEAKVQAIHRLRINVKSLSAEARFIRQEERRCAKCYRDGLSAHRRTTLREESRRANLALAFIRGVPRSTVEPKVLKPVNQTLLKLKINKFLTASEVKIGEWLKT